MPGEQAALYADLIEENREPAPLPMPGNLAESSIAKAPRTHCAAKCSTSQRNRDEWNLSPTGQPFMCARATRLMYWPSGEPSASRPFGHGFSKPFKWLWFALMDCTLYGLP